MIKDNIQNAHQYDDLHQNFWSVMEILQSLNLDALQPGYIELDGKYVYININETNSKTKEEALLESHRQYIDIQMPLTGTETFGIKQTAECTKPIDEFDTERDIIFYEDTPTEYVTISKGEFVIFFPEDAHAPCINTANNHLKLIVKISIEPNKEKPTL